MKSKQEKTSPVKKIEINPVKRKKVRKILEMLTGCYPDAGTSLHFQTTFQLLVAAILSAQCTDRQVNKITGRLFKKYCTPADFAVMNPEELAEKIKGCGLHRNKSRFIIEASRALLKNHGGKVPESRKELEALPGVGRKTAGVVLGVAFRGASIPVDTHVYRVAHRLGISNARDPVKVEEELSFYIPPAMRMTAHHLFIAHGRRVCKARKPACGDCCLRDLCRYPLVAER